MGKPYSLDLRKRVVAAIEGGMSRNQAAKQFGVAISTAINWVKRVEETGSVAPGKMGGHKPKAISGEHAALVIAADQSRRLHPARARGRACRAWAEGRLPLGVGVRPCREAQLQKKAWWLANAIVPTWRGGGRSGQSIKIASNLSVSSSSTRPGPGPIWRHCGDGRSRGHRLTAKVPHGRWKTMTFLAALRHDRIDAPWFIEGPIDGESFRTYVGKGSSADASPRRYRRLGQSRQPQRQSRASAHSLRRRQALLPAKILTRPEPHRTGLCQTQAPRCERPPLEPSTPSAPRSAKSSKPSRPKNAPTTSKTQAIEPNFITL